MSRTLLCRLLCTTSVALAPSIVAAQTSADAGQGSGSLEEVVVTAQKRSERLSDVPLSIAVASAEQLADAGVTSPVDLGKVVPGFTYQPSNYGPPVFSVRGIGFFDNTLFTPPTVSVYVDQVPLPYLIMTAGAALDLERVEVLKGPQGTLFGQNSTGGAINFIAAKPTGDPSFGASAEYARFDQVSFGGFASGPLSDTLGVRLAARTEQGGAWQKSLTRPGDELGDRDFTSGRLTLDWAPSETARLAFTASGWIDKSETRASQYIRYAVNRPPPTGYTTQAAALLAAPAAPRDSRLADWDADADLRADTDFYMLSLSGEFDLSDAVTLTTITAYSQFDTFQPVDPDGTDFNNFLARGFGKLDVFSQEVRLSGAAGERLKWMLGGNYVYDDSRDMRNVELNASNSGLGPRRYTFVDLFNNVETKAAAIFGSLDHELTDTLLAQVSVRYTDQQKDGRACLADTGDGLLAAAFSQLSATPIPAGACVTFIAPGVPTNGLIHIPLDETNVSWRANLSWKPNSDVHLYANVTKGYKSGAFSNLALVTTDQYQPVPQESVLAYETGFKLSALNRAMQLSGATFYYDYTDKQILGYVLTGFGNLPGLVTVPESRVIGAELNLSWLPIRGLTLNGGVTYVDSEVRKSFITRDPFGANVDIKGYSFPITSQWQASGDAEYEFPLPNALKGFVGTNITYRDSTPATFGGGSEFVLPSYTLVDLRAGIENDDGRWRVEIWGRNVSDEFYLLNIHHVVDTLDRVPGNPATYGIALSTRF